MMTEEGILTIGLEYEGKNHREFTLRPQLVRDSVEAVEESDRAKTNEHYLGLAVLAKQLTRLGDIPPDKITPELLMDMYATDSEVMNAALKRLQERQKSFRGESKAGTKADPGTHEAGLPAT